MKNLRNDLYPPPPGRSLPLADSKVIGYVGLLRVQSSELHLDSLSMKKAAADLKAGSKGLPVRLKKLLSDEAQRAEFEAEVMEGMSLQQQVNCKMPEVRRTRDPQKAAVCMKEYRKLLKCVIDRFGHRRTGDFQ